MAAIDCDLCASYCSDREGLSALSSQLWLYVLLGVLEGSAAPVSAVVCNGQGTGLFHQVVILCVSTF